MTSRSSRPTSLSIGDVWSASTRLLTQKPFDAHSEKAELPFRRVWPAESVNALLDRKPPDVGDRAVVLVRRHFPKRASLEAVTQMNKDAALVFRSQQYRSHRKLHAKRLERLALRRSWPGCGVGAQGKPNDQPTFRTSLVGDCCSAKPETE